MAAWDTLELLGEVRSRGGLPAADLRYTDARLLAAASVELRDVIAPMMVESQTDRCVYLADMAVSPGVAEYRLPTRALGMRAQSVAFAQTGDEQYQRLKHLAASAYYLQSSTTQARPTGFFVRDNTLVLVPTPSTAGTLRVPYYQRPATLVLPSAVDTYVGTEGSALVVDAPGGITNISYDIWMTYEVVRASPGFEVIGSFTTDPSNNESLGVGYAISFLTGEIPPSIALGDYVCPAGYAPVAQCPPELLGLLAVRTARRALKGAGEQGQSGLLDADVAELTDAAVRLLTPRVDDEPRVFGDIRRGVLYGLL